MKSIILTNQDRFSEYGVFIKGFFHKAEYSCRKTINGLQGKSHSHFEGAKIPSFKIPKLIIEYLVTNMIVLEYPHQFATLSCLDRLAHFVTLLNLNKLPLSISNLIPKPIHSFHFICISPLSTCFLSFLVLLPSSYKTFFLKTTSYQQRRFWP